MWNWSGDRSFTVKLGLNKSFRNRLWKALSDRDEFKFISETMGWNRKLTARKGTFKMLPKEVTLPDMCKAGKRPDMYTLPYID